MVKHTIYIITNLINNKKYVGQTHKKAEQRFKEHIYNASTQRMQHYPLYKAFNKYGIKNFSLEIVEENIPSSIINEKEIYYIKEFNTLTKNKQGYNVASGGGGVMGHRHQEETKKRISLKSKEWWKDLKENRPEEYKALCEKRGNNLRGVKKSPEHCRALSSSAKKRTGKLNPFYGHKHSEETIKTISSKNSVAVGMYDKNTLCLIKVFASLLEATQYLLDEGLSKNVSASSRISKICQGKDKTAYGYVWKFME